MSDSNDDKRFRILVCVDSSVECARSLRFVVRLGSNKDTDVTLLNIRKSDRDLRTGGLQMQLAHQNLLDWGIDLPGQRALKEARDFLIDMGFLQRDWLARTIHKDVTGDALGDNMVEYSSKDGRRITLKMKVAPSVTRGILEECEQTHYDLMIVSAAETAEDDEVSGMEASAAASLAAEADLPVLFARTPEGSRAHLVCVNETEASLEAAKKDAMIAARCFCPITLFAVAEKEKALGAARNAVKLAKEAIEETGIEVADQKVMVGDPVRKIIDEAEDYSLIALSASGKGGLQRFISGSVPFQVLETAPTSVIIVR